MTGESRIDWLGAGAQAIKEHRRATALLIALLEREMAASFGFSAINMSDRNHRLFVIVIHMSIKILCSLMEMEFARIVTSNYSDKTMDIRLPGKILGERTACL